MTDKPLQHLAVSIVYEDPERKLTTVSFTMHKEDYQSMMATRRDVTVNFNRASWLFDGNDAEGNPFSVELIDGVKSITSSLTMVQEDMDRFKSEIEGLLSPPQKKDGIHHLFASMRRDKTWPPEWVIFPGISLDKAGFRHKDWSETKPTMLLADCPPIMQLIQKHHAGNAFRLCFDASQEERQRVITMYLHTPLP
jgi:hypothetical protein